MDEEWAVRRLENFLKLAAVVPSGPQSRRVVYVGTFGQMGNGASPLTDAIVVVEKIMDRVTPGWRPRVATTNPDTLRFHREAAIRAIAELRNRVELEERLGSDNSPRLRAAALHPWVWEGARSLWQSGHYREAVRAASVKVNAETQNKLGRRDVAETDLFRQAFTDDAPTPQANRLRPEGDDAGKTSLSLRRGIRAFAEGCYAGIRNPASHDEGDLGDC